MKKRDQQEFSSVILTSLLSGVLGLAAYWPIINFRGSGDFNFGDWVAFGLLFTSVGVAVRLAKLLFKGLRIANSSFFNNYKGATATLVPQPESPELPKRKIKVNQKDMVFEQTLQGLPLPRPGATSRNNEATVFDRLLLNGKGSPPGSNYIEGQVTASELRATLKSASATKHGKGLSVRTLGKKLGLSKYWVILNLISEVGEKTGYLFITESENKHKCLNYKWRGIFYVIIGVKAPHLGITVPPDAWGKM